MTPLVKEGIDTMSPVVKEATDKAIEYATPAAKLAADRAMEAIQPYIDQGKAIPQDLLKQAEAVAGNERVTQALQAEKATRTGVASVLRGAAGFLDGFDGSGGSGGSPGAAPTLSSGASPGTGLAASKAAGAAGSGSMPRAPPVPKALLAGPNSASSAIQGAIEAKKAAAMAPIIRFEEELKLKALQFGALSVGGLVTIGLVRRFFKPLEDLVQRCTAISHCRLLLSVASHTCHVPCLPPCLSVYQTDSLSACQPPESSSRPSSPVSSMAV